MKLITKIFLFITLLTSCTGFLERAPLDQITPEVYFTKAQQLGDYAIKYYSFSFSSDPKVLASPERFLLQDNATDIQIAGGINNRWLPGELRVSATKSDWTFTNIRAFNYFLEQVLPKYEAGKISGTEKDIKHYIGEIYFLRAYEYFEKVKAFGDFPIITEVLSEEDEELISANERKPFNHVARFILSDLDKAIGLLTSASDDGNRRNRITMDAALLFKSRVSLYVGTWLKYFNGTAFVPGGDGWPGASKDYNTGIVLYENGIDAEIRFFLEECLASAEIIADKISLTKNTYSDPTKLQTSPYVRMFADYDLSTYPEVILWKGYSLGQGLFHGVNNIVQWPVSAGNSGYSRGYVESFLMNNAKPIYALASGYADDLTYEGIKKNRDDRLVQFLKYKGDELAPDFFADAPSIVGGGSSELSTTGYVFKKYKSNKAGAAGNKDDTGCPIFRAVEAYLNYMEADYELNGSVNTKSKGYWEKIRTRARITGGYEITDQHTDMSKEAVNNFAAYSAGNVIDKTLYNIRRERQSEFISEGFRYDDLRRWRSMDQIINTPFHPEGFNLWGSTEFQSWYTEKMFYIGDNSGKTPNISAPGLSNYIRPYQINRANLLFDGMKWTPAHYLSPIDVGQFNITSSVPSEGGDISYDTSPLYQNPGWTIVANSGAVMVSGF